jgi:hypothetical protein
MAAANLTFAASAKSKDFSAGFPRFWFASAG